MVLAQSPVVPLIVLAKIFHYSKVEHRPFLFTYSIGKTKKNTLHIHCRYILNNLDVLKIN